MRRETSRVTASRKRNIDDNDDKSRCTHEELIICRALVDQGSQISKSFKETAQTLNLRKQKKRTELYGVGISKAVVKLRIRPRLSSDDKFKADAVVLTKVVSPQPPQSFEYDKNIWKY